MGFHETKVRCGHNLPLNSKQDSHLESKGHSSSHCKLPNSTFNYEKIQSACVSIVAVHESGELFFGSGFIVSHDGYIVTGYHIIVGADTYWAHINNVNSVPGVYKTLQLDLIGVDIAADVAVLKVRSVPGQTKITHQAKLEFADSLDVIPGSDVYIVGDPLAMDHVSVSKGVVRDNRYTENFVVDGPAPPDWPFETLAFLTFPEFILTDITAIPGASGSPIINSEGKVVGIFTIAIQVDGEIFPNMSGGLASVILERIVRTIIRTQANYVKSFMGLLPLPMDNLVISTLGELGQLEPTGYFILEIDVNGPFAAHPEVVHDVLLKVNGKRVGINYRQSNPAFFTWHHLPGETVTCEFLFSGKITIVLAPYPPQLEIPANPAGVSYKPKKRLLKSTKQAIVAKARDRFKQRLHK